MALNSWLNIRFVVPFGRFDLIRQLKHRYGPFIGDMVDFLSGVIDGISVTGWWKGDVRWNCGSWAPPALWLLMATFMIISLFAIQRDWILYCKISVTKLTRNHNKSTQALIKAFAEFLARAMLFGMQTILSISTGLLLMAAKGSAITPYACSANDLKLQDKLVSVSTIVIVPSFTVVSIMNIFLSHNEPLTTKSLAGQLKHAFYAYTICFWRLILLTFGIWTKDAINAHKILQRAWDFNVDKKEDTPDNKHLEVLSITGSSRSIVWAMLPPCMIFFKLAEAFNAYPVFILSQTVVPRTAKWRRWSCWASEVTTFLATVGIVVSPMAIFAWLLPMSLLPPFVINLAAELFDINKNKERANQEMKKKPKGDQKNKI